MPKFVSKFVAVTVAVALPFVFSGCDKTTSEKTKEVTTTTKPADGTVIKKEETTTTTTKDK